MISFVLEKYQPVVPENLEELIAKRLEKFEGRVNEPGLFGEIADDLKEFLTPYMAKYTVAFTTNEPVPK